MVVLPLGRVCEILYDEAISAGVGVLFKHRVLPQIGQTDDKAWVDVDAGGDVKRFEADYIVGCDGGNSQIRRSLFGDLEFPGWTWNQQIIASNVSDNHLSRSRAQVNVTVGLTGLLGLLSL